MENSVSGLVEKTEPVCLRCGTCCRNRITLAFIQANPSDLQRWHSQKRDDILRYFPDEPVSALTSLGPSKLLRRCPFLRRVKKGFYECTIHDTKPEICLGWYCQKSLKPDTVPGR